MQVNYWYSLKELLLKFVFPLHFICKLIKSQAVACSNNFALFSLGLFKKEHNVFKQVYGQSLILNQTHPYRFTKNVKLRQPLKECDYSILTMKSMPSHSRKCFTNFSSPVEILSGINPNSKNVHRHLAPLMVRKLISGTIRDPHTLTTASLPITFHPSHLEGSPRSRTQEWTFKS